MSFTRLEYHYQDASVPPPFHRSYRLTVTPTEAHLRVDSYGEVVNEVTRPLPPEAFVELTTVVEAAGLRSVPETEPEEGCSGGTGESLALFAEDALLLRGSLSHCGGGTYGDLAGDLPAVREAARALFGPDFRALLRED